MEFAEFVICGICSTLNWEDWENISSLSHTLPWPVFCQACVLHPPSLWTLGYLLAAWETKQVRTVGETANFFPKTQQEDFLYSTAASQGNRWQHWFPLLYNSGYNAETSASIRTTDQLFLSADTGWPVSIWSAQPCKLSTAMGLDRPSSRPAVFCPHFICWKKQEKTFFALKSPQKLIRLK